MAMIHKEHAKFGWWATTFDASKEYSNHWNWVIIGSAGDPTTWEGVKIIPK